MAKCRNKQSINEQIKFKVMRTKVMLCIQCKYPDSQKVGDFLKTEAGESFSPLFNDLIPLFDWIKSNYPDAKKVGYSHYLL